MAFAAFIAVGRPGRRLHRYVPRVDLMTPKRSLAAARREAAGHALDPRWRRSALVTTGLCLLAFFVLAAKVHRLPSPLHIDVWAQWWVSARPMGFPLVPVRAAQVFQQLGTPGFFAFLVSLLVLGAALLRDRVGALLALVGPPGAVFLTDAVGKPGVARPEGYMAANAFPSGHVTAMAAIAATAAVLAYRRWGVRGLAIASPFAVLLPSVMTLVVTRLHSHDFTDGLGGIAVGAGTVTAVALLLSATFERPALHGSQDRPWARTRDEATALPMVETGDSDRAGPHRG